MRTSIKTVFTIVLLLLIAFILIGILGKVLSPFIIALILSYIFNPLVEWFHQKLNCSRAFLGLIFALIAFGVLLSIPLAIIPLLITQLKVLSLSIPGLVLQINHGLLDIVNQEYGTHLHFNVSILRNFMVNHVSMLSPVATDGLAIMRYLVYIILIPFAMFYLIKNYPSVTESFYELIPRSYVDLVRSFMSDVDSVLSAYLRGQISVMIIMAMFYGIGLYFIKLNFGAAIGVATGFLVFIPYIGVITGLTVSMLVSFASLHELHQIVWILALFVAGHLLEGGIITPWFIGEKLGLNPVMMILSLMVFGCLLGISGVLLALPLTAITVVLFKYVKNYYVKSNYYQAPN